MTSGTKPDAVFVFAGGQARKEHAARLWRDAVAPVLVVSVARFEWRRYALLGLPGTEKLHAAVQHLPPKERHFFVILERGNADIRHVVPRRWGTRNEARALALLARERRWRSLLVISSGFHLPRVALVVERALRGSGCAVAYEAPPAGTDPHGPGRWWRSRRGIRLVGSEVAKRLIYAFLKP